MDVHEVALLVFALLVALTTVLVTGRLVWCVILASAARDYRTAALSTVGVACLLALLCAVLFMWFILAVSHMQKDIGDTYRVMAYTGLPYFLAAFGLWRFATRHHFRLRSTSTQLHAQEGHAVKPRAP